MGDILRRLLTLSAALLIGLLLLAPANAAAQQLQTFSAYVLGGVGGSVDADGTGFGNQALQLGFTWRTDRRTHIGVRVGDLEFDAGENLEGVVEADLTYLAVVGEYRTGEGFYESGVFLGLGAYNLDGILLATGDAVDDTSVGLVVGVLGDFELTRRLSFRAEGSGHYLLGDFAQIYALAQAGFVVRF